jgi:hypothetical protein
MALLGDEERERAAVGVDTDEADTHTTKPPLSTKDKKAMVLLCVLCEYNLW